MQATVVQAKLAKAEKKKKKKLKKLQKAASDEVNGTVEEVPVAQEPVPSNEKKKKKKRKAEDAENGRLMMLRSVV